MTNWRDRLHEIIFEAETSAGKAFDVALLVCIVASVVTVLFESVASVRARHGDLFPQTVPGKLLASTVMILGYGIIAVPTGIVTVELANVRRMSITTRACSQCAVEGHDTDADYCKRCGAQL